MVRNLLLLTIDSLRADTIADQRVETPSINKLIADGVSFDHAFATGPGTSPSFTALLSGTLPLSFGGLGPLSPDRPRLAACLRHEGYQTAGFHSNPFLSEYFNYDVGFDRFEDYQNPLLGVATTVFPRGIEVSNPKLRRLDRLLNLTGIIKKTYQAIGGKPRPYVTAEVISDDIINWLESAQSPFFCWAHYMDVHQPCYPPKNYRQRFGVEDLTQSESAKWYSLSLKSPGKLTVEQRDKHRRLADAAIAYTDDQLGRILKYLSSSGKYSDTLTVFASDHGHMFGDHGEYGKPERMYDELIKVPLVIANGPERLTHSSDNLISLLDLPPTIHNILGLKIPQDYEGQVIGDGEPRSVVVSEHEVDGNAVIGARSLNWLYEHDSVRGENRLYDLRNGRFGPASSANHQEATKVRDVVRARLRDLNIQPQDWDGVQEDVRGRLEDLGYR